MSVAKIRKDLFLGAVLVIVMFMLAYNIYDIFWLQNQISETHKALTARETVVNVISKDQLIQNVFGYDLTMVSYKKEEEVIKLQLCGSLNEIIRFINSELADNYCKEYQMEIKRNTDIVYELSIAIY